MGMMYISQRNALIVTELCIVQILTISIPTNKIPSDDHLPTPIDIDRLSSLLDGYDPSKVKYLVKGFSEGFHIMSEKPQKI